MAKASQKTLPFYREMQFEYGQLEQVEPGLRRFVCNNPSHYTFKGTNTYVLGHGSVAIVDPGPSTLPHPHPVLQLLGQETVSHILITHAHADHSGAARVLKENTKALLCGFPRRSDDPALRSEAPSGGTPFIAFTGYDIDLEDGSIVEGDNWKIEAIHTPGHAPDHLCYRLNHTPVLLSGDHVMGWNTTIIAPPEGHMGSYIKSLERLLTVSAAIFYPGHGGPVIEPQRFVKALIMHRRWREADIAEWLRRGLTTIDQLVPKIYVGLPPDLQGAAALSVLAQLELMVEKGLACFEEQAPLSLSHHFGPGPKLSR